MKLKLKSRKEQKVQGSDTTKADLKADADDSKINTEIIEILLIVMSSFFVTTMIYN